MKSRNTKRILKRNTMVKINGIPLRLKESVMVESNDSNFDLISEENIDPYGGMSFERDRINLK